MSKSQPHETLDQLIQNLYYDNLDVAETLIYDLEKSNKITFDKVNEIGLILLKSRYFRQKRKFSSAEKLVKGISIPDSLVNPVVSFKILIEKELIKFQQGFYQKIPNDNNNRDTISSTLELADSKLSQMNSKMKDELEHDIGILFNLKGLFHYYIRNIEKSISLFRQSQVILRKTEDLYQEASSVLNIAYGQLYLGDLTGAEKNLNSIEDRVEKYQDKELLFWVTQGYAIIHSFQGNMQSSLKYYKSCIDLLGPMNAPGMEADVLHILGIIYWERAELDNALQSFGKIMRLPLDKVNQTALAISLFYTILIYLEKNDTDKANEIYSQLEEVANSTDDTLYKFGSKLAKTLILKYSPKLMDKLIAKQQFEELNKVIIENSRLSLIILGQISEILLLEYKAVEDPEILIQIKSLMDEMYSIGTKQQSSLIIADSYYILSKIAIIEDDLATAKQYLIKGLELAEDKQLLNIAKRFSKEYDALTKSNDIQFVGVDHKTKNPFFDFEEAIRNIGKTTSFDDVSEIEPESPVMILLINEGGNVRYTQTFEKGTKINEHLIGSFITAINAFMQNAFDSVKPLERLHYNEYTIALNTFNNTLVCYIFKGDSFFAFKKLRSISEKILANEDLNEKLKANPTSLEGMKTLDNEKELIDLIEKTILSNVA